MEVVQTREIFQVTPFIWNLNSPREMNPHNHNNNNMFKCFLCLTNIGPLVVSGISMNHIHLKYGEKDLLVASSPSHQDIRAHPLVSKSLAPKPTTLPALPIDIASPHLFQAVTKSTMPWVQRMSSQVGGGLRDDACDHYSDVIYMWIKPRGKNSPSKEV